MPLSLRRDRGATDPLLIIAGIAISLILLVGGSFAVSAFITNTQDRSARDDLARVATAQVAYHTENDRYASLAVGPDIAPAKKNSELINGRVGYKNDTNANIVVTANKGGWTAVTASKSGKVFVRSSFDNRTREVEGKAGVPASALGPEKLSRTNLAMYPNGSLSKPVTSASFGYAADRYAADGQFRNVIGATDAPAGLTSYLRYTAGSPALTTKGYGVHVSANVDYATPGAYIAPVTAGETYTISSFFRGSSAGSAAIRLRFASDGAWTAPAFETYAKYTPGKWKLLSQTFTVPAGVTHLGMNIQRTAGVKPNDTFDVTGLFVEKGASSALPYFDGGTLDTQTNIHKWVGSENSSSSRLYTRAIIGTGTAWIPVGQPNGMELPVGITWTKVTEDMMLVKPKP